MSIVYKRAEEFSAGDTIILAIDNWAAPVKVLDVARNFYTTWLTVEDWDYLYNVPYKYTFALNNDYMLRIPPINPRVVYND